MALNWQWNDKMGKCKYKNGYESNLYRGNALCIANNEWEKDGKQFYSLAWFAADKEHLANMLGLNKGYEECFTSFNISEIWLNTKYKETAQMVQMFAKAKIEITIHLYKGESK